MKSSIENISPTRVKLSVEVPFDDLQPSIEEAYKRISAQVTIPGFRKGKVPRQVIDQRFGRGVVLEEALNTAVPSAYEDAVREHEIVPLAQPELDITDLQDGDKISFTAEVDVRPSIELPDLSNLEVTVDEATVSDEDVDAALDDLRARFATIAAVERPAADGDIVVIDIEGTADGEPVEGFSGKAMSYEVGSNGMVEGIDDVLRGASEGDDVTLTYTPPEGPLADQEVSFAIHVGGVRERTLPEADDEFAMMASEYDTIDELRDDLRTQAGRMKLLDQGMQARQRLTDQLLDSVEIPVPDSIIAAQVQEHFQDGHGDDEHRAEVESNLRRDVATSFLFDQLADDREVGVDQQEFGQWLVSQAPRYGMSPDQLADALVQSGQVTAAVADLRRGKALAELLAETKIVDEAGNEVDLTALDDVEAEVEEELEEEIEELEEALVEAEAEVIAAEIAAEVDAEAALTVRSVSSDAEFAAAEEASLNAEIDAQEAAAAEQGEDK